MQFCLHAVGRLPERLFDVQLAAGLVGMEYPAGYGVLISKLLGRESQRRETRTDWRGRPLSNQQVEYALEDVLHLHPIRDELQARLQQLGRVEWLAEEMAASREQLKAAQSSQRWRRVSGNSGLDGRGLAIIRELWRWREAEAQRRDRPARRVLRDDLIVELARRRTAEVRRIRVVRGLERGDLRQRLAEIAGCIRRALELPEEQCPQTARREHTPRYSVLGQFLFSALGSICRQARIAANLVGTPDDIRDLITYRTAGDRSGQREPPKLARGWRAEFVGRLFEDLLAGKMSIRIKDPSCEDPLVFEPNP
jgi:ribonuclease D